MNSNRYSEGKANCVKLTCESNWDHKQIKHARIISEVMLINILLNDRYQIQEKLGSGGMSEVYRAYDLTLERSVAVKILRQHFSSDADFKVRFHQEAKAAANLSHPNIVTIHDFGLDSDRLYIVMEYVPGNDLKSILREKGSLPVREAISLMIQACSGIGHAHRAGLVHCDVKPQNMLITPDKRLKVTDFGIARALASIHPEEKSDVVWGSPQYFSPEQASGYAPFPASDVYSLGIVLFETLTGSLPFTGGSAIDLAHAHQFTEPPLPSSINQEIPEALDQIILKVLSKEPASRYRSADHLGRILVAVSQEFRDAENEDVPADLLTIESAERLQDEVYPNTSGTRNQIKTETERTPTVKKRDYNPLDIDWITWGLGLLALIAIGGLIPLWLWVYLLYNSAR
jgi:serine/threonine protein kinase